jgi:predicted ArsR family transcriptional regulator
MLNDAMPPPFSGAPIGMTIPASAAAREMARQLLERETAVATGAAGLGAMLQRASTRVADDLRQSVGEDGYSALLVRALSRTQTDHPVLKDIRRADPAGMQLDVVGGVEGHGAATVGAALEALLATVVDILSDLIGADMVRSLLDHDDRPRAHRNGRSP